MCTSLTRKLSYRLCADWFFGAVGGPFHAEIVKNPLHLAHPKAILFI